MVTANSILQYSDSSYGEDTSDILKEHYEIECSWYKSSGKKYHYKENKKAKQSQFRRQKQSEESKKAQIQLYQKFELEFVGMTMSKADNKRLEKQKKDLEKKLKKNKNLMEKKMLFEKEEKELQNMMMKPKQKKKFKKKQY
jgi:hypothetical protein